MIGKIVATGLLLIGTAASLYNAGRFAAGAKEVREGQSAVAVSITAALINLVVAGLLFLDY